MNIEHEVRAKLGLLVIVIVILYIVFNFISELLNKHDAKKKILKTEDQWSCIAHLSAEDILQSAVIKV